MPVASGRPSSPPTLLPKPHWRAIFESRIDFSRLPQQFCVWGVRVRNEQSTSRVHKATQMLSSLSLSLSLSLSISLYFGPKRGKPLLFYPSLFQWIGCKKIQGSWNKISGKNLSQYSKKVFLSLSLSLSLFLLVKNKKWFLEDKTNLEIFIVQDACAQDVTSLSHVSLSLWINWIKRPGNTYLMGMVMWFQTTAELFTQSHSNVLQHYSYRNSDFLLKKNIFKKNMLQVQTKPIKWFLNHYLKVKCVIDLKRHPQY